MGPILLIFRFLALTSHSYYLPSFFLYVVGHSITLFSKSFPCLFVISRQSSFLLLHWKTLCIYGSCFLRPWGSSPGNAQSLCTLADPNPSLGASLVAQMLKTQHKAGDLGLILNQSRSREEPCYSVFLHGNSIWMKEPGEQDGVVTKSQTQLNDQHNPASTGFFSTIHSLILFLSYRTLIKNWSDMVVKKFSSG